MLYFSIAVSVDETETEMQLVSRLRAARVYWNASSPFSIRRRLLRGKKEGGRDGSLGYLLYLGVW
jgi:hypothetical protein